MLRLASAVAVAALVAAASPVSGFRPPATPLITQSPLINLWSTTDALNGGSTTFWTGDVSDLCAAVRVDGVSYLLMGNPQQVWSGSALQTATQLGFPVVLATQTHYYFAAGPTSVNLTFTSPLLTDDWDLLSRPAHYVTFDVAATDGGEHGVQLYFDLSSQMVINGANEQVSWSRNPITGPTIPSSASITALGVGNSVQNPLADTNDRMNWGIAYLVLNTDATDPTHATGALNYANTTRSAFFATGTPAADFAGPQPAPAIGGRTYEPATGPQVGVDRPGADMPGSPFNLPSADPNLCWAACNTTSGCVNWAYGIPNCGGDPAQAQCWLKSSDEPTSAQSCRISGRQAGVFGPGVPFVAAAVYDLGKTVGPARASRVVTIAVDEFLSIDWFGSPQPPYWRRALPIGNTSVVPVDMMAAAYTEYEAVRTACDLFDAQTANQLSNVGGDKYATLSQLTYRQVFGAMQLVWNPDKQDAWYYLKEISSCGCLHTADVIYPAFPQVTYYSPELMKRMIISHLEYAMNYTNVPYPLPWAPHHLGYWPIANLPASGQENMPLEETSWDLLIIALIAQRQGGDLTWLEPYWPLLPAWYDFLVTLLPFPGVQLSTDDFDGVLYNATNLALKGLASMAAYGYILETYTGNITAAAEVYATAARYAQTMVQYAWLNNASQSHFMIGYAGSQGDGGDPNSWAMLYNLLWFRLLGYDNLLPNQTALVNQQALWYQQNPLAASGPSIYGLPLNSRKLFTKDDWMTFMAATYYDNNTPPQPSALSNALFDGFFNWANETTSREPISDWTNTDSPTAVGFTARPVYGAMYAPMLVAETVAASQRADPAIQHARRVFASVHGEELPM